MRGRGGFMLTELFIGFGILATAATIFLIALSRGNLAFDQLSQRRQATRGAEAALSQLQAGLNVEPSDSDMKLSVEPDKEPSGVRGWGWVRITCNVRGQSRSLVGLVPDESAASPTTRPAERSAP